MTTRTTLEPANRQRRIRDHLRSNVVGYVALFCFAVGGTAIAAGEKAPKDSVVSKSIKNRTVSAKDVKASRVQLRVGESCPAGRAIRAINVDGGVLCAENDQGGDGGAPSGPAGGSLTGEYPNPTLAPNSVGTDQLASDAVGTNQIADDAANSSKLAPNSVGASELADTTVDSAKVADNALTGGDVLNRSLTNVDVANNGLGGGEVDEATLGQVPSALIGGLGRDSVEGACDPESTVFLTCTSVTVTVPVSGARALLVGRIRGISEGSNLESGFCRLGTSTIGAVPASTIRISTLENIAFFPLNGITPPLPAGLNSFGIDCTEVAGGDGIEYDEAKVSAVVISPG